MSSAQRPALSRLRVNPVVAACALIGAVPFAQAQDAASGTLAPVVVTGKGFEQRAFDTPYSVGTVDEEVLRNAGPMINLSEAMARVPGLTVANRNNYAQDLQINSRGYGARSTFGVRGMRLYSDGIPATMPDGQGQVSHFDLAGAQRVEVLRGPFSALYGNSSGGVIALVSQPVRERYGELGADIGRFGLRQGRVTVQAPLGDEPGRGFDLRFGASYLDYDGFRPQSSARRTLANLRLGWTGERDTVVVSVNHVDQPADDPLGLNRAQFDADPRQTAAVATQFNTRKTAQQEQIGATWRHRFADLGALNESAVTAYFGQRSVTQWQSIPVLTQRNPTPPPNTDRHPGGVIDFDRDYQGLDGRLIWRWTLDGDRSAQFVAGAALERSTEDRRGYENFLGDPLAPTALGVTGNQRRDEKNTVKTTDVYAQGELEFVKDWVATLGARSGRVRFEADDHYVSGLNGDDSGSLKYSYTNPVAALQWRGLPDWNFYVSAGEGFESPTFGELAYRPDGGSGFNNGLKAQTSKQIELGAKWRDDARGLAADFAVFEARTDDEIGVATNAGGRSTFQNVGSTTRRGVELGAGWSITSHWRTALALTWLSATYDDAFVTCTAVPCNGANPGNQATVPAGNRIAGTSPRSAFAELAWRPFGTAATELAAELRGQDEVAVNDRNTDFAGTWATWALRATQSWKLAEGSRIDALVRVDNLFDREYAGSVIVNDGNGRFFEPGMPRNWLLSVKWRQAF
ncbi:TonB-dependent receptor [Methylibium sp. Pch-M]|uniref:TonB-dependent receptor family protein n=1 Tax=Methylibium sp. Pch-M TaxID=2082386 RepID=UPI001011C4CA|nr:TonB-dependent receptor [Methylibium sp. Pch-M]QAZ38482.1 TonB-dependent receptor [Methylibium sp. Pch-M]